MCIDDKDYSDYSIFGSCFTWDTFAVLDLLDLWAIRRFLFRCRAAELPRHLSYEAQLFWKREHVQQAMAEAGPAISAIFSFQNLGFQRVDILQIGRGNMVVDG